MTTQQAQSKKKYWKWRRYDATCMHLRYFAVRVNKSEWMGNFEERNGNAADTAPEYRQWLVNWGKNHLFDEFTDCSDVELWNLRRSISGACTR